MTGPDCYQEALRLVGSAHEFNIEGDSAAHDRCLAEAQVLATLSLAAATALGREGEGRTQPSQDKAAWFAVAAECRKAAAA